MIKIIDRYLGRHYLLIASTLLIALSFIYLAFDFFEKIDNFSEAHIASRIIITYFLLEIPQIIVQMLPAAFFLGAIISLSILKRHNEVLALQASGLSPYRISWPYLCLGLMATIVILVTNETIIPQTRNITSNIWNVQVEKRHMPGGFLQGNIWLKGKNAFYQINMVNLKKKELYGLTVYIFDSDFQIRSRIDAQKAVWQAKEKKWLFFKGIQQIFKGQTVEVHPFVKRYFSLYETPKDLEFLKLNYEQLNLTHLYRYIKQLKRQGYDATIYEVDFWQHLFSPLSPLILIILGVGLIFKELKAQILHNIALGMFLAFLFWVIQALFLALGKGGHLSAFWAAFIPYGLFGIWGAVMLKYSAE